MSTGIERRLARLEGCTTARPLLVVWGDAPLPVDADRYDVLAVRWAEQGESLKMMGVSDE